MPVPTPTIPQAAFPTPVPPAAAPSGPAAVPSPDIISSKRTVLGVPGANLPGVAPAPVVAPPSPEPRIPNPASSWDAAQAALAALPSSKRTMLGVPTPGGVQIGGEVVPVPPGAPQGAPHAQEPPPPEGPRPPSVQVAPELFHVTDPSVPRVPAAAAGARKASTERIVPGSRDSLEAPRKSRVGMVFAIIIGLLAVAGIVAVLVFREDIFGGGAAGPAQLRDGAVATQVVADGGVVPGTDGSGAVAAQPPRIDVRLVYSGDGATIELEFGQITSTRAVNEIRLATGPRAGTPDALVAPGRKVPLADFLPAGTEPAPGTVKIPMDVLYGDGATERVENELRVPYTFRAQLVPDAAEPTVHLAFKIVPGPGLTLEVAGKPVAVQADGSAVYDSAVEPLRAQEGLARETGSRVDLSLPFAVRGPEGVVAEGTAAVSVPVVPLRVDFPADRSMTTGDSVWVRGETAPGATLALDGAAVTVGENGVFAVEVPLIEGGERTLALVAAKAGALGRAANLVVRRVGRTELERLAVEWAGQLTEQLGYADFAEAAASFRGRKVDLLGRISSVPAARDGVLSFVLFVDTESGCPATEVCAVMVHAPTAQVLSERDQVRVLGEIQGRERTTSEKFPELPAVRAAFVVPR
jgi:hypothetical protein